jgi:hypothetical protein
MCCQVPTFSLRAAPSNCTTHPLPQSFVPTFAFRTVDPLSQATTSTFIRCEDLVSLALAKKWAFQDTHGPLSISSPIRHFCRDVAFDLHGFS